MKNNFGSSFFSFHCEASASIVWYFWKVLQHTVSGQESPQHTVANFQTWLRCFPKDEENQYIVLWLLLSIPYVALSRCKEFWDLPFWPIWWVSLSGEAELQGWALKASKANKLNCGCASSNHNCCSSSFSVAESKTTPIGLVPSGSTLQATTLFLSAAASKARL